MTQGVVHLRNTTKGAYSVGNATNRAYHKGIGHLRKVLLKNGEALTQAGSLIVRGLGHMRKCAVHQQVRRLLFANTPPNRFRPRLFCGS
jgi:hypothetical protein